GATQESRLEASGVALLSDRTVLIVFDNLNRVARVDLSLERKSRNALLPVASPGSGFEDVAFDRSSGHAFCLIESAEDPEGALHGFVVEYDEALRFLACTRLPGRLKQANKGFEGLEHARTGARELLYALREGDGVVEVLSRASARAWTPSHRIRLQKET